MCSLNMKLPYNNKALVNNFNDWCTDNHVHIHLAILCDEISRSRCNLLTFLLRFSHLSLVSQRERDTKKSERTHSGAVDKS